MTDKSAITYPLSFQEALEKVMNGDGWAQGEGFNDGEIMMERGSSFIDGLDHLHIHDFNASFGERKSTLQINQNLIRQRFRLVTTKYEAMRKS